MIQPTLQDILSNPQKINKRIYKIHYHEFIDFLDHTYPGLKFSEQLYRYYYNLKESPKCPVCGKPVKYINFTIGYSKHCSTKCASSDPNTINKVKQTCKDRYGDENYNNRQKSVETCQEKYGCSNPFQNKDIQEKIKTTINERYGTDYPSQSKIVQQTREINSLQKYGVPHHMMVDAIKNKVNKSLEEYHILHNPDIISYDENGDRIMKCPHPLCNKCKEKCYNINSINYYARKEYGLEPCTKLLPIKGDHSAGTTLELFIRNILDEYNIAYETNVRNIIPPKELDIYIPSKHIAIECNGLYWHSGKDSKYHYNKYKECKDRDIQLLTIWEDQIYREPEIIKSIILNKLGTCNTHIGARECIIKEIGPTECNNFLNNNHLQGGTKPQVRLGLYYINKLVGAMTFSKRSALSGPKNNNDWELTRFCTLLNTHIPGAASKLLKYFINQYHPQIIISFASNDISNGKLYKTLGFIEEDYTTSYWYIDKKTLKRYHRSRFTKVNLKKMGYDGDTEEKIMSTLPYYKIFDCGHTRYKLTLNN